MANETQLKEVEYACGNCGMSEIIKINCGVNTDWHETVKCRRRTQRGKLSTVGIGEGHQVGRARCEALLPRNQTALQELKQRRQDR